MRRTRVDEPHVAPLNDLARSLRTQGEGHRFVPWFDPDGGGTTAHVLVLMETPGPRTVAAGDLGFSTEDNTDPTAAALRAARAASGLDRSAYVRWNVVPWPLHDGAGHRRPPRVRDLDEARPALAALLDLLPALELVVAVGTPALTGVMRHLTLDPPDRVPRVLGVPHPSPRNAGQQQEARARLANALRAGVRPPERR